MRMMTKPRISLRKARETKMNESQLRQSGMSKGLDYHKNKAKADIKLVKQQLALAQIQFDMKGAVFTWLVKDFDIKRSFKEQWKIYQKKSAPEWAKQEYKEFWRVVINIYKERLKSPDLLTASTGSSISSRRGSGTSSIKDNSNATK